MVAQVVAAGQSLGDFQVFVSYSIAEVVILVFADMADALVLREGWNVDVRAGHHEG